MRDARWCGSRSMIAFTPTRRCWRQAQRRSVFGRWRARGRAETRKTVSCQIMCCRDWMRMDRRSPRGWQPQGCGHERGADTCSTTGPTINRTATPWFGSARQHENACEHCAKTDVRNRQLPVRARIVRANTPRTFAARSRNVRRTFATPYPYPYPKVLLTKNLHHRHGGDRLTEGRSSRSSTRRTRSTWAGRRPSRSGPRPSRTAPTRPRSSPERSAMPTNDATRTRNTRSIRRPGSTRRAGRTTPSRLRVASRLPTTNRSPPSCAAQMPQDSPSRPGGRCHRGETHDPARDD